MIAVDTSALMAIVLDEADADACAAALGGEDRLVISAVSVAEALIVATLRNVGDEMSRLVGGLGLEIVNVTPATSERVAIAYRRWGKGVHPAALTFGDCFAYDVAKEHSCRLLYVGNDFARTDLASALHRT